MKDTILKFRFKDKAIVVNAPSILESEFKAFNFKTLAFITESSSNTLVFVNNNKELLSLLSEQLKYIQPDSVFWIAFPKGTSKIKTDITRDIIRETAEEYGIKTVTAISIDETWSALRFRPLDKVGT